MSVLPGVAFAHADKIGYRIYHDGIGESGKSIVAHGIGGTVLSASQAACGNCHRRSGYGSSEGGMLAPPVIGKLLFKQRDFHYRELKRNMSRPITRPAYTKKSFIRAIRDGIAANDKPLQSLMPRYSLSRSEIRHLLAYLHDMGKDDARGVDEENIYLATVITPDVPENLKKAMLTILHAYVKNKNAETREEHERAVKSPWHRSWKYEAYRRWKLQVWELTGEPADWTAQLDRFYSRRPVFAMVSGLGTGTWQPVHDFCESKRLPCLFPSVTNPVDSQQDYYSIYFSRGIKLQVNTLVRHLQQSANKPGTYKVLQVVDESQNSKFRANILSGEITSGDQDNRIPVDTVSLGDLRNSILESNRKYILISWVPLPGLEKAILGKEEVIERIYVPSVNPYPVKYKNKFTTDIYFVHPYTLPSKLDRVLLRESSWARINHLDITDREISANTYFAVTLLTSAIKHLRSNFSRNYMIERIEHMLDNNVFNSVYPHLTLGPGQRYASKGCYIVGPFRDPSLLNTAKTGQWIVP